MPAKFNVSTQTCRMNQRCLMLTFAGCKVYISMDSACECLRAICCGRAAYVLVWRQWSAGHKFWAHQCWMIMLSEKSYGK